jgi:hypothetical protein
LFFLQILRRRLLDFLSTHLGSQVLLHLG